MITASVAGPESGHYGFTSALPLAVLKQLAPAISQRFDGDAGLPGAVAAFAGARERSAASTAARGRGRARVAPQPRHRATNPRLEAAAPGDSAVHGPGRRIASPLWIDAPCARSGGRERSGW